MEWTELTPLSVANLEDLEERITTAESAIAIGKLNTYNAIVAKNITPTTQAFTDLVSAINLLNTVAADADLISENILIGKNIFGVSGLITPAKVTPGVVAFGASTAQVSTNSTSPIKVKEIRLKVYGTVRVKYQALCYDSTGYIMIYVNGVARGTLRSIGNTGSFVLYTEDINVVAGDLVQLYMWTGAGINYAWAQSFSINIAETFIDVII